jgi:hypothetical protein
MRYAVLLCLFALPHLGFAQTQKELFIISTHPEDASRLHCQLRQASFTIPEGWKPHNSGGKSTIILSYGDETSKNATMLIDFGIGISKEPTSKELAESWAKEWKGGEVQKETTKLDGEEAYRVTIPADGELKPVEALLLVKDKRAFMIMCGAKVDSKEIKMALEEIRKTWKWNSK